MKTDVVLLHGWGLNSGIWGDFIEFAAVHAPQIQLHCLDLPGYGHKATEPSSHELSELAAACLKDAPDTAIWVGWSLGGMVAMQAALQSGNERISGLQLIATSPKFIKGDDWPQGTDKAVFENFSMAFSDDYEKALIGFLLLQSGANKGARQLARQAHRRICDWPNPALETLQSGLACLAKSDLRHDLDKPSQFIDIPVQVLSGQLDRIVRPEGAHALAALMQAELVNLPCGHAPFLEQPRAVLDHLLNLVAKVHANRG